MDLLHLVCSSSPWLTANSTLFAIGQPIMFSLSSFVAVSSLALQAFASPNRNIVQHDDAGPPERSIDSFIATENPIALADLLCNIGSSGACAPGASSGVVIASPDKTNPDCTILHLPFQYQTNTFCRLLHVDPRFSIDFQVYCRHSYLQLFCLTSNRDRKLYQRSGLYPDSSKPIGRS